MVYPNNPTAESFSFLAPVLQGLKLEVWGEGKGGGRGRKGGENSSRATQRDLNFVT